MYQLLVEKNVVARGGVGDNTLLFVSCLHDFSGASGWLSYNAGCWIRWLFLDLIQQGSSHVSFLGPFVWSLPDIRCWTRWTVDL